MSNTLLNAMLALIENRPEVARSLLRSPELKNISVSEVQSRVYILIDKIKADAARDALRKIMQQSMRIDPLAVKPVGGIADSITQETFMEGVVAVESLLENAIAELEP